MSPEHPRVPATKLTGEAKGLANEASTLTDKATTLADLAAPVKADAGHVLPPKTTAENDRATYGQRRVNMIWEVTQSLVAMSVTASTLYVAANLALQNNGKEAAFLLLSNGFFLVIGFYFGRTNHQKTGGVTGGEVGR